LTGLVVAALRHLGQQAKQDLHVKLARLKPDARKRGPGSSRLQEPLSLFSGSES
jgi:hypothetical protein